MICLFSSIKEIFTGQPLISFQGGACKARKSVITDPCTCLPDSNISFINVCKISDTVFVKPFPRGMSFSVALHFAVKILNTKTQKRKNAKWRLQCTDNQCDMICVILRTFVKGAKWGVLRGWFWLFADGWPLIFCNNMSKNAFCFVFWAGGVLPRPAPLQFQWKSFSDYPTPFFIAGFSFWFRQKNKRTFEFGQYSYETYVLVSGLFFTLAFGRWLLAIGR